MFHMTAVLKLKILSEVNVYVNVTYDFSSQVNIENLERDEWMFM
jgi:hypothetical protein